MSVFFSGWWKTLVLFICLVSFSSMAKGASPLLLKKYTDQNVYGWLMSEKLDGIRAVWDGKNLRTRRGNVLAAPAWFLEGLPPFAIDGELWSKRGDFENIQSIVMKEQPHDGWKQLTYNIFDVPGRKGGLKERLAALEIWLSRNNAFYLRILPQTECRGKEHLDLFHKEIELKGGEGVVLRDPAAPYVHGRTDRALKVKSVQDAECIVTKLHGGRGKYEGMLGSFTCQLANGVLFRIGSGLEDRERRDPPSPGDLVTFRYQGWTAKGKPRFPIFQRVRLQEKNLKTQ